MKNRLLLLGLLGLLSVNVIAQGSWQWMDLIKGVDDDVSREIVLDADNNLYVFAQIEGTVNVGGDVFTSFGNFDALLVKFDQSGDYQWTRRITFMSLEDLKELLSLILQAPEDLDNWLTAIRMH